MRLGRAIEHAIILAAATIVAVGVVLSPGNAMALDHNEYPDMATDCDNCHTLNEALKEQNTSLIRAGARTLPSMKSLNSNQPPSTFGCTFCHANTGRTTYMRDALEHFSGKTSQHPVDRAYTWDDNTHRNITLGAASNNTRWMSNWDGSWTGKPANQIGCIDCHQMDRAYPNHPAQDNALRTGNPVMLKGGNGSWDNTVGHASNAFCLSVCHAGTAPGTSGYRMGHYGWGAFNSSDNTIREPGGTPLKQTRCVDCHESHYATSSANLFGELGSPARISVSDSTKSIDPVNCTAVCHDGAAFSSRGHGTTSANQCASCHNTSNDQLSGGSHRNSSNPKRLTNAEVPPPSPSLTDNLVANGLDDDYDGVVDNPEEASVSKSVESICKTCHQAYIGHGGSIQGAPSHSNYASCLFCHDPHGKALFNGVDNNVKMLRGKILGKTTRYVAADNNLWRPDGTGLCDNQKCHGGKPMGTSALESNTVMGDVADHKAANVGYATDCIGCHTHTTTSGSFKPDCNSCHEYPGQQFLSGTHRLSSVHKVHAFSPGATNGYDNGYGFTCGTCHNSYTHNKLTWGPGTWDNALTVVDVVFDPAKNPGATYDNSLPGAYTGTCNGLTCHGGKLPAAAQGTDTTPLWNDPSTGACGTCHKVTAAAPPGTGAHPDHAASATGYAIGCNVCHYETTNNGTSISNRSVHTDNQSRVTFNTSDWRFTSAGSGYGGSYAIGDSGADANDRCNNLYCHSVASAKTFPYGGVVQTPQWDNTAKLACTGCHGNPPSYANPPTGPKANTHPAHSTAPAGFTCQVCHWATTEDGSSIPQAKKANHVNGAWDAVSEGNLTANPAATSKQQSHDFAYDNGSKTCSTADCHGGTAPVWGAAGPITCDVCHKNTGGAPAAADADDFFWDNGVMTKIRDSEWTTTGHGRPTGLPYNSGRAAANFTSCTTRCHSTGVSHNAPNNPFRLMDNASNTDFNDTSDPRSLKDNKICLDCHSAAGATPSDSTLHVEENHYGKKHNVQDRGGSFCWDCHDPHGDPSDSMIHDNVTRRSDGQYGVPVTRVATSFGKTNLNGETSYNGVYDWGDYVKNTSPYTGICQVCHSTPAGPSGGTTGGAAFFNEALYTADHNKGAGQGQRCTDCHFHTADFAPSCNACHGSSDLGTGAPPYGPSVAKAGLNQLWSPSVDNVISLAGVGNHRSFAGYIDNSSHDPWMGSTGLCGQCHTSTPGSGTHNLAGMLNAPMDNLASHDWYNGAQASWDNGGTTGTVNVVDDSCSNIDCHGPYYGATANQYHSGTPTPYKRYWVNKTLWDCYTCHAYDGRTGVGSRPRPGGADNTMATGAHGRHVGATQIACANCHANVANYAGPSFGFGTTAHKNGVVDWSFAGSPNPPFYPAPPVTAYNVTSGSRAPTDDNAAAGHGQWGSCSNIYCHSIVQTAAGGALTAWVGYATASWDNALTGQCGTCHAGDGVSGNLSKMASGSHAQHLASGYAMSCDACHTGAGTGHAAHADGIIEVPIGDNTWRVFTLTAASTIFDRATAPGVDNANKTPGAARGRCANIACHTNGAAGAPRVNPAVWGDNQAAAGNCTYCHGGNTGSGASMTTNAHGKHVVFGYLCSSCHADTVAAGADNVLNANVGKGAALHVDNQVQVISGNGYTFAWNGGTKDCSNISCHGGNAANWVTGVGTLKCGSCHLAAADSDQYQSASDTWFNNDNIATLNATEWGYSGHGKTSLSYDVSGHPAADFPGGAGSGDPCRYCHDPNSTHRQSSNPFRLVRQDNVAKYATEGWNATCLVCHSKATPPDGYGAVYGYTSKVGASNDRVDTAHYGTKHGTDNTAGGRFCWDCHDAHGDRVNSSTGNIYMIQSAALAKSDGVYGYRGTAGEVTAAVTFKLDNTVNLGGDWARSDFRGVCQVCHHGNGTGSSTEAKYYTQSAFQNHNKDKVCTSCHEHDKNFRASCNACHGEATGVGVNGMPPYAPSAGNNPWPSRTSVDNVSTPGGIGNHRAVPAASIDNSSHETFECTECHTNTPGSGGTHDNASNANAAMTNLLARKWTDGTTATTWTARNAGRTATTGSVVDDSCSNVDCHSPYYSGNAAKSGTPFPYERYWENKTLWDCYTCHGYTAAGDSTNNPGGSLRTIGSASHPAHVVDLNYSVPCTTCHVDNSGNLGHKDGLVQVQVTGAIGAVTLAGSYTTNPVMPQPPTDNGASHRAWGTCSTVYCHSTVQKNNPDGLPNDGVTYKVTPQWGAGASSIVCGSCHKGAGSFHTNDGSWIDTGSHTVHAQTKQYRCTNCHQYPGQPPNGSLGKCGGCHPMDGTVNRHVDGYINVRFGDTIDPDNVFILSGVFDNNGDHVNDNTIVPGAPYGTCESLYCHGTGTPALTGGANQYSGTPNIPKWGDVNTSRCGSCHAGPGGATNYPGKASNYPTSGAHAIHMDNTSMAGPRIAACTDCHTANTTASHVDGRVDFRKSYLDNSPTTMDSTNTCDPCHGLGAPAAKTNWASAGALDCLTCHMNGSLANSKADLTGITAPNVGGDNATYGSYYTGHNRTGATYPVSGNQPGNRVCADCHDTALRHIDGTDNTTYAGNRLRTTVSGNATGSTVSGLCDACHAKSGTITVAKNKINTHGNAGYAANLENQSASSPASPGAFAATCDQCHEVHGMVNGPAGPNIWMISPSIRVNGSMVVDNVVFTSRTGANSFNNTKGSTPLAGYGAVKEICAVCHAATNAPYSPMTYNVSGWHNAPNYKGDETGKDCSSCHTHNKDDSTLTVDGLMPQACNACHSYPGLDNTGTNLHQMSSGHWKHAGKPGAGGLTGSRGYPCAVCHYDYPTGHNETQVSAGIPWPSYQDNVDIRFDASWNPNPTTYSGRTTPTYGGGSQVCAGLYCHGGNATLNVGWGGTGTTPAWNGSAGCGACHAYTGTTLAQGNHPVHLNSASKPQGPVGLSACTDCHIAYGLSPDNTHVNNAVDFRVSVSDNSQARPLGTTQVCRFCHSISTAWTGSGGLSGDNIVRSSANWDNVSYSVACVTCHNNAPSGNTPPDTQGTVNPDGSGNKAPNIDSAYATSGHGTAAINKVCTQCHNAAAGHIGANKVATNPWRLLAATNHSVNGGLDTFCATGLGCHSTSAPDDHTYNVAAGESKEPATDTHPTSALAVPAGKDRWYQVPNNDNVPLFGHLLNSGYNKSTGDNNYVVCVSCHDPHGVGTAALPVSVRNFSGVNNDNNIPGRKMMRYDYSSGVPTPLCSVCHK